MLLETMFLLLLLPPPPLLLLLLTTITAAPTHWSSRRGQTGARCLPG
jgi:hypothetical protein